MTGHSAADDEAHLAALLAVLALARADVPSRTPLQQWRARRLAALAAEGGTSGRSSALPLAAGQRRAL